MKLLINLRRKQKNIKIKLLKKGSLFVYLIKKHSILIITFSSNDFTKKDTILNKLDIYFHGKLLV